MPINVLIVDDSMTIRMVVKQVLEQTGLEIGDIHQATDGVDALKQLGDRPVDLVLSDINMPNMDGLELVRSLQKDERTARIPVVMVTTEGSEATLREALNAGAKGYVTKPFTPEDLAETLERCGIA